MRLRSTVKGVCLVAGLLAVLLRPAPAAGQEENPILTFVKSKVKDADKPFTLVVSLKVKEGEGKKLEAAFAKARRATLKEKGCRAYDLSRDTDDPTRYQVYERWQSLAALKEHLATAHTKALLGELPGFLAGAPTPRVLIPAGE